jgi:hypothetical protein
MGAIRTTLLVLAIAAMLPSPPEEREAQSGPKAKADARDTYVGAAVDTVADLVPFCGQHEIVCGTARYLLARIEVKARYNFDLLYDWARSEHVGARLPPLANQAKADPIPTGTAARLSERVKGPRNTLRLDDLIPAWRGPGASQS